MAWLAQDIYLNIVKIFDLNLDILNVFKVLMLNLVMIFFIRVAS